MALPRTWSEELAAEYLELSGFFVKTGHPVQIGGAGGRKEIDALGLKIENNKLKVLQVEIGSPAKREEETKKMIENKFDEKIKKEIARIVKDFGYVGDFDWERWYIITWGKHEQMRKELGEKGIKVYILPQFLNDIKEKVRRWKKENKTAKGIEPELPDNLWLLKVVDSLERFKKMRLPNTTSNRYSYGSHP